MLGFDMGRCCILGGQILGGSFDICDSVEIVFDCEDFAASLIKIVEMFRKG